MEWIFASASLCFIILCFLHLKRKHQIISSYHPQIQHHSEELGLSVLICIRGHAPRFPVYFEKLISQNYSNYEIIIIYKDIPKSIQSFIEEQMIRHSQVSIYEIAEDVHPYIEKKQALNLGIIHAKHEWVVTIDDDCYPENEQWLASIQNHILSLHSDILLGFSPYIAQHDLVNQWIRFDAFHVAMNYAEQTIKGNPYMGIGRNMAFKKSLWTKDYLEKYMNYGSGDDSSLVQHYRDKVKIDLMCLPFVYSFPKTRFNDWFFQKLRHIKMGNSLNRYTMIELIKLPLISIGFWIVIWFWLSFLSFHFMIFGFIIIYTVVKMFFYHSISQKLSFKKKPILYTLLFDFWYNFSILLMPFLSIFIQRKWK